MKDAFSFLAGLLCIVGFIPYVLSIWLTRHQPLGTPGKAEPTKASWIVWALLDGITLAGMIAKRTTNGQIVGALVGSWVVVGLTLKYGKGGWTKLDIGCIASGIVGIALWATLKDPLLAIGVSLTVLFVGSIPTFISTWNNPGSESKSSWTIFWFSGVAAMFGIPHWTFEHAAQPLVFFAVQNIMLFLLYVRPWLQRNLASRLTPS